MREEEKIREVAQQAVGLEIMVGFSRLILVG